MLGETKDKTCREPGLTLLYVQRVRRRAALYSTSRAGGWLAMIPRDELEQEGEEERLMLLPDFWDWEEEELELLQPWHSWLTVKSTTGATSETGKTGRRAATR